MIKLVNSKLDNMEQFIIKIHTHILCTEEKYKDKDKWKEEG
jgi:hypothetical protein